jgi:hypothetical protein
MNSAMDDDPEDTPASSPTAKNEVGKVPVDKVIKIEGNTATDSTQFNAEARLALKDNRQVVGSQTTKYVPCLFHRCLFLVKNRYKLSSQIQ